MLLRPIELAILLVGIFLLAYPALGFVTGTIVWYTNEERFEHFLAEKQANARPRR